MMTGFMTALMSVRFLFDFIMSERGQICFFESRYHPNYIWT